ncbi:hypothetical protein B0H16DRAFT_1746369 [Mycena metata]|uniref:Uncharacterized protein n=1 Tax=Mycena metata TaxID=1033252 RepID=A0AAD7GYQ3_9AGAR|nr:hypothetical protein B0H16DRAFT_1746369 [Mycena metata]
MEHQTDPAQVEKVPGRYKSFGLMARQYSFAKRAKRAGRRHDPTGLDGTVNRECWQDVAPEFQFLYMLILALDANFRLKSRLRANERDDPPLGDGWGYIVEEAPYKEHLRNYVAEKDITLLQKDTRLTTGLRCSGVGGVVCARHEVVRPQGIGDLQKGERYANMDYILLSAIIGITALYLAVSYDIACQWQINLPKRLESMPDHLKINLVLITLLFALPRERGRFLIPSRGISWATKEMGRGARADAIEDKIDHHNWEKNINQGTTLPCKLILAIDERNCQVAAFKEVDQTLSKNVRKEWQKKIDNWKADRTKPNPYLIGEGKNNGPSEATICLALTKGEAEEVATGGGKLHGSSVTSFLVAGLQLEEAQQRIKSYACGRVLLAADQQERVQEMRIAFFSKLKRWRRLQADYMSAAVHELEEEEDAWDPDLPPPNAEDGCRPGLPAMEGKLREGQCCDSLRVLRSRLHAKRHLLNYRDESVVGQRAATRAYTLIERIGEQVGAVSGKYRRARTALIALRGRAVCEGFCELKASDIQLDEEREVDARARKRLSEIGSRPRRKGPALSSKDKVFLWIWTAGGGPGEDEAALHDFRVEWSKAKARKERWEEEVALLREEMKRVLRFLCWRAVWWESKHSSCTQVSRELASGLKAYAAHQASLHREITRKFKGAWDTSAATAVRMAVREDALLIEGMSVFTRVEDAQGAEASTGVEGADVQGAEASRGMEGVQGTEV